MTWMYFFDKLPLEFRLKRSGKELILLAQMVEVDILCQ
jgi:hypothetical protein